MPEQIEVPDGQWVDARVLYQSLDWGQVRGGNRVDGAGNTYILSVFAHWNATIAYLRKYSPQGQVMGKWNVVFEGAPHDANWLNQAWNGSGKIDDAAMCPAGRFMAVALFGHNTNEERQNPVAVALIDVDYRPFGAGQNPEDGGYPVFTPGPNPVPGDIEVDYDRIERFVIAAVNAGINELIGNFGGTSVRSGLMEKTEDGVDRLFTNPEQLPKPGEEGYDPRVAPFQHKFFQVVKNANAGVWYNILRGEDPPGEHWNHDRREEFKTLIREAAAEELKAYMLALMAGEDETKEA